MRALLGEDCTAGSRVYVQDSVYDKFVGHLIEKVKSTPIGDGFDEAVTCGPIVSDRASSFRDLRYLIQNFDRSRRLNSIRFGATSIPGNVKVPKFWLAERGVVAKVTSWILQVELPALTSSIVTYPRCLFTWESLRRCSTRHENRESAVPPLSVC